MLAIMVSLLILTGFLFFHADALEPTAAPHPEYPSLLQSTGPYDSLGSWTGVVFGLLLISSMTLTMIIGLYRKGRSAKLRGWILRCVAIYATVWVLIKLTDDIYLASDAPSYFGGFPIPTALLVFGMGIFPYMLIPFYYRHFSTDIHSDEDQAKFDALMEARKESEGGAL